MQKLLKIFGLVSVLTCSAIFTQAQNSVNLTLGKKKTIKRVFQPKTLQSKTFFTFYADKNRTVDIKIESNGVDLGDEYPCYLFFNVHDKDKNRVNEGDYPEGGADEWLGELKKSGIYKIEIFVSSVQSCDEKILREKKAKFAYTLEITLK
jgi:hypothetical protein